MVYQVRMLSSMESIDGEGCGGNVTRHVGKQRLEKMLTKQS